MSCVSHHHACDCREKIFREMEARIEKLRGILDRCVRQWKQGHVVDAASYIAEDAQRLLAELDGTEGK